MAKRGVNVSQRKPRVGTYAALIVLAAFALLPVLILVMNSLKTKADVVSSPLGLPTKPILTNFSRAWTLGRYDVTLLNSALITVGTVICVCFVAVLAAYSLTRLELPGKSFVILYLFVCSAIPQQIFLVPLFFLFTKVGLVDSRVGLIIIYVAVFSPFCTLLLRSYLLALPSDFEEAARTEGANELQVVMRIVLPMMLPGVSTIALVSGLMAWNEFLFAVTFIQDDSAKPVTTSFLSFQDAFSENWGLTSAGALYVIVPVIILFLILQRRFVEGLAAGGLK